MDILAFKEQIDVLLLEHGIDGCRSLQGLELSANIAELAIQYAFERQVAALTAKRGG